MKKANCFTFVLTLLFFVLLGGVVQASSIPRPEHPRPDFQRDAWVNLNGTWAFDFDPSEMGEQQEWFLPGEHTFSREIVIPYPMEAPLSGSGYTYYEVGTTWQTDDIWIRHRFNLDGPIESAILSLCHDEDMEVYLNGHLILARQGYIDNYIDVELGPGTLAHFVQGENILAAHCHQTVGGQYAYEMVGSYGGDNTLVMTGGTLDIGPWGFNIGRGGNWDNNHVGSSGHVLMSGGVINTQGIALPEQWGTEPVISGELVMEGGTINADWMHMGNEVGIGMLELKGGILNAGSFEMKSENASIDVAGGTLIMDGDKVAQIQGYIDSGWITSSGTLELDFDVTNAGKTTLKASGFDSPVEKASTPYPADGAVDVLPDTILSWTADPAATQHFVYLLATPADPNAPPAYALSRVALATDVVDGEGVFAPVALNEEDVLVPVELDYDTTYLWAVDLGVDGSQPYDPNTVKGDTWTFTTITDPNTLD